MIQLPTSFVHRDAFATSLRRNFPVAAAHSPELSYIVGGRTTALKQLALVDVTSYAATRNMLSGCVTQLSPYFRHGIITLAEVRRVVLKQGFRENAYKLLQELARRDYYQRVYNLLGEDIWQDIEPYKTGVTHYETDLPQDISSGTTGLACIDTFARELRETGYLHNHARMWIAAYVIHHRRVRWQAGARWFLQHLLDGDPASNNLSWQWVASTFSAKPYYFNQENLAHYSENKYCERCPLQQHGCPFASSYETVAKRIFGTQAPHKQPIAQNCDTLSFRLVQDRQQNKADGQDNMACVPVGTLDQRVIIWLHDECLHPQSPVLMAHPQATPIFIFDETELEQAGWSLKRIAFLYESLLEIPKIQIYLGSPVEVLTNLQRQRSEQLGQAVIFATMPAISPHLREQMRELAEIAPVYFYQFEAFAPMGVVRDLRRFSRYWERAEYAVLSRATDTKKLGGDGNRL
jgi:deoxyribodipyrimidine photo-lyase